MKNLDEAIKNLRAGAEFRSDLVNKTITLRLEPENMVMLEIFAAIQNKSLAEYLYENFSEILTDFCKTTSEGQAVLKHIAYEMPRGVKKLLKLHESGWEGSALAILDNEKVISVDLSGSWLDNCWGDDESEKEK